MSVPRTRGDDPELVNYLGIDNSTTEKKERLRVPRTRGDDPRHQVVRSIGSRCSPHTRG